MPKEILDFMKFSQKLKNQKRDILMPDGTYESVADHSWHLALMVMLVHPKLEGKADLLRSLKMVLVHDLVEAEIGDLPYFERDKDADLKAWKHKQEQKEIARIREMISGDLGQEIYDLWHEFEEQKTEEAKFCKALDSMEANYQAIMLEDISYWDDSYYKSAFFKADKYCKHEPILHALNEEIKNRTEIELNKLGLERPTN